MKDEAVVKDLKGKPKTKRVKKETWDFIVRTVVINKDGSNSEVNLEQSSKTKIVRAV